MNKVISRLQEYIDTDLIYQDYKKGNTQEFSDFEVFCINHCKDIETVLNLINKQDKIIDLMAEFFNNRSWKEHSLKSDICNCCKVDYGSDECIPCIKEYFEELLKESE